MKLLFAAILLCTFGFIYCNAADSSRVYFPNISIHTSVTEGVQAGEHFFAYCDSKIEDNKMELSIRISITATNDSATLVGGRSVSKLENIIDYFRGRDHGSIYRTTVDIELLSRIDERTFNRLEIMRSVIDTDGVKEVQIWTYPRFSNHENVNTGVLTSASKFCRISGYKIKIADVLSGEYLNNPLTRIEYTFIDKKSVLHGPLGEIAVFCGTNKSE